MGKKASGLPPGIDKAVGQASLGQIPGSNVAGPATPYRILGKDLSSQIAPTMGAIGTGTWSAASPSAIGNAIGWGQTSSMGGAVPPNVPNPQGMRTAQLMRNQYER